jgi:hypothetical protein
MDYDLIGNAAIYGALASLAMTSLGLGFTGRMSGVLLLLIALAALGLSGWMLVDWTHISGVPTATLLSRLGTIAGGSLAGALVGAILPLILSAIGEASRGDEI